MAIEDLTTQPSTHDTQTAGDATTDATTRSEHVVALIEPTDDHDTTLDIARGVTARGGDATVVMLVTKRVREAAGAYADGARLRPADAEEFVLDRYAHDSARRVGGSVATALAYSPARRLDLAPFLRPDTTAIAVPERLMRTHAVRRLASKTGLPIVVAPRRAA